MAKRDVTIRLPHKKAKALYEAISKGVFDKLTPSQGDAVEEFAFELHCQVMQEY